MNYVISKLALKKIRGDAETLRKVRIRLMDRFDIITGATIITWLDKKSPMLTTPDAVEVISECTGLLSHQIIERISLRSGV